MSHILGRGCSRIKMIIEGDAFKVLCTSNTKPGFCVARGLSSAVTSESNPVNHSVNDIGLFYKIDNDLSLDSLFKFGALHPDFFDQCKTFGGTYIMIRKPALEIINCLRHTNYNNPVNRYVLYGKRGCGVSTVMLHLVHYAHAAGWLVVHVPKTVQWMTEKTERVESSTKEGLLDLPAVGSHWLTHFKSQNLNVINTLNLRLQNNYSWNIQEENKKGDSLFSLLDHGISRGTYSCDVVSALLEEVKLFSKAGIVKTLVVIDNYSIIFHPGRKSSNKKYKNIAPSQISFMESFKNLAKPDWHNGAVVLSCLSEKVLTDNTDHFPLNKLTLKGFEFLYPFVPIEVPQLTDKEMTNVLDFYRSLNWILTSEADSELKVLSDGYIDMLNKLCGPL